KPRRRNFAKPRGVVGKDNFIRYRSGIRDCAVCPLKPRCRPHTPERKISRSICEGARDMARAIATTEAHAESRRLRKKAEILFAHLKRILGLRRFRLRGPCGESDEVHLAAAAQNLRRLAKRPTGAPTPNPA
ncbi:MAG: transposase, partial [Rubrimonas sp.]